MTPLAFLSRAGGGGAKIVVILPLAGFSREFCSSPRRTAAHPKGSDTPSSSDPRLPFNADATSRSAFSEKYLISLLLFPSREGSFLSKCFLRVPLIPPHSTFLLNSETAGGLLEPITTALSDKGGVSLWTSWQFIAVSYR